MALKCISICGQSCITKSHFHLTYLKRHLELCKLKDNDKIHIYYGIIVSIKYLIHCCLILIECDTKSISMHYPGIEVNRARHTFIQPRPI